MSFSLEIYCFRGILCHMINVKSSYNWTERFKCLNSVSRSSGKEEKSGVKSSLEEVFISSFYNLRWLNTGYKRPKIGSRDRMETAMKWRKSVREFRGPPRLLLAQPAWQELIRCESFNFVFVTDSIPQRMLLTNTQNKLLGWNVIWSGMPEKKKGPTGSLTL